MFDHLSRLAETNPSFGIAVKGLIGTVAPIVAAVTSFQEQIEWHLRIVAMIFGIAVSVASLISIFRTKK